MTIDKTCTEKDPIYVFKVRDYTTEIVGRKNKAGFYYVQRGDGNIIKYDADRVVKNTMIRKRIK